MNKILTSKLQSDRDRQRKRNIALTDMTFMTGNASGNSDSETMKIYQRITRERKEEEEENKKH